MNNLEELYNKTKEQGYDVPKDILKIHSWLMTQGYCPLVSGVKLFLGESLEWNINFHKYCKWSPNDKKEDWHFSGYKQASGTFEDAMIDGMIWALHELERDRQDPDWLAKALANTTFVSPDIDD